MSSYAQRTAALFSRCFPLRFTGRIIDWARKWIKLQSEESADFPGDYDDALNPLPTLLFDLYESGDYDEVITIKASQTGWTMICFIFITWWITFVRRNFMYVIDSEEVVEVIAKDRLKPMIENCTPANAKVRAEKSALGKAVLRFNGLIGYLAGLLSLGKLSNKSIGLAVIDETAAAEKAGSRATIMANMKEIRARLKKQSHHFLVHLSKAGEWEGQVNQEYLVGTRHKCFLPCPHCTEKNESVLDGFQVLEWENIKFGHCKDARGHYDTARMMTETHYECVHCKSAILESHKHWMIKNRQWRQTYFGEDPAHPLVYRRASVEHTDLYNIFPNPELSWGGLACKFTAALGNAEAMKNFFKDHLAKPERKKEVKIDEAIIYKMTAGYKRGQCPFPPRKVLMASDHQPGTWPWVKVAFSYEGDCWVVDWGICLNPETLTEIADTPVEILHWPDHVPMEQRVDPVVYRGLVDDHFDQKTVRDFLISTLTSWVGDTPEYRFLGCYGLARHTARSLKDLVSPGPIAPPNAFHNGFPLWSYAISTENFNQEIYQHRYGRFREILSAQHDGREAPQHIRRIYFPECIFSREQGDEVKFVHQITREVFEFNDKLQRFEWRDVSDNDWGDALRMCFALWYLLAQLEDAPMPISLPTSDKPKGRDYEVVMQKKVA